MKVKFLQSGGYAGLIRGCELDTNSLPGDEATKLQSLVEESGILQVKSDRTQNAADLLNYQISVETNAGESSVSFDDLSLPESVEPLVEYLRTQAKPLPRS